MTGHQKPEEAPAPAKIGAGNTKTAEAKSALADAVARRNETLKHGDQHAGRVAHGGKPFSNLKVTHQIRGK